MGVDCREYQENLLDQVYADKDVRSHVWVSELVEGEWHVADFGIGRGRGEWRRSQGLVSGVRVVQAPEGEDWVCVSPHGLPAEEGPPSVYIQFNVEHPDDPTH